LIYLIKGEDLCTDRYTKKLFYKILIFFIFIIYIFFKIFYFISHNEDFKPNEYSIFILFILILLRNTENTSKKDIKQEECLRLEVTKNIYIFLIYLVIFLALCFDNSIFNFVKFIVFLYMIKNFWLNERRVTRKSAIIFFYLNFVHILFVSIFQYRVRYREKDETIVFLCQLILKNDMNPIEESHDLIENNTLFYKIKNFFQEKIMINLFLYLTLYLSILIKNHIYYENYKENRKNGSKYRKNTSNEIFRGADKRKKVECNSSSEEIKENLISNDLNSLNNSEIRQNEQNLYKILKSKFFMNLFIVINFINMSLNFILDPIFILDIFEIFFSIILISYFINKINEQTKTGTKFVNFNNIWKFDLTVKFCIFLIFYFFDNFSNYCK